MTDREKAAKALYHLERTTITYAEYKRRVREKVYTKAQAEHTHWGQALNLLNGLSRARVTEGPVSPPAPVVPPVVQPSSEPLSSVAQNMAFAAQDPLSERCPPHWKIALSADPAFKAWATPTVVQELRRRGHRVYSWCDCETTMPFAAKLMLATLKLDGWIGQAENGAQWNVAVADHAEIIVGNPNSLSQQQRIEANGRIASGKLAFIGECYANEDGTFPATWSGAGVNVASLCMGLYPTARGYVSVNDYKQRCAPSVWAGIGLYHVAGVKATDWALLP